MRRNWDTIRSVLLAVEAGGIDLARPIVLHPGDTTSAPHLRMLIEGVFVRIEPTGLVLTHTGHDLLDAIRDDAVWSKCQIVIAANDGGLPTDVLLALARGCIGSRIQPQPASNA